jgi:hypothetical protein
MWVSASGARASAALLFLAGSFGWLLSCFSGQPSGYGRQRQERKPITPCQGNTQTHARSLFATTNRLGTMQDDWHAGDYTCSTLERRMHSLHPHPEWLYGTKEVWGLTPGQVLVDLRSQFEKPVTKRLLLKSGFGVCAHLTASERCLQGFDVFAGFTDAARVRMSLHGAVSS